MHPHLKPFYHERIRPLCIGHRGAAGIRRENTLAGFRTAIEVGVDGIEFDVRLSADHIPVVIHDAHLGKNSILGRKLVSRMNALDIQRHEFESAASFDEAGSRGIPALADVLDLFSSVRPVLINLELKGRRFSRPLSLEAILHVAHASPVRHQLLYSSFFPRVLEAVRKMDPHAAIGYLFNSRTPRSIRNYWIDRLKPDALHPQSRLVLRSRPERIKQFDAPVNVWTVNDPDELVRLRDWGVDGIITDFPDVFRKTLHTN